MQLTPHFAFKKDTTLELAERVKSYIGKGGLVRLEEVRKNDDGYEVTVSTFDDTLKLSVTDDSFNIEKAKAQKSEILALRDTGYVGIKWSLEAGMSR